jgi:hypothetical protein
MCAFSAQLLAELLADAVRVGALAVELVDERHAGDVVPAHLAVDGDRLRLHAGDAAQHQDRAVEHAERALDLDGEVDVPGGVDDVDVDVLPLAVRGGGLDGDAALALELHRVHLRADAVLAAHLVDGVDPLRVEQDALGERGLAGVDVGADPDVPDFRQVVEHGVAGVEGSERTTRLADRRTGGKGAGRRAPSRAGRGVPHSAAGRGGPVRSNPRGRHEPMRPMSVMVGGIALFFALACSSSTEPPPPPPTPAPAAEPEPEPEPEPAGEEEGKAGKGAKGDAGDGGKAGKGKKGG